MKSVDTASCSVYARYFFNFSDSEAVLIADLIASKEAPVLSLTVRSTTDTFATGTLNAIPVSFPLSSGITCKQ